MWTVHAHETPRRWEIWHPTWHSICIFCRSARVLKAWGQCIEDKTNAGQHSYRVPHHTIISDMRVFKQEDNAAHGNVS
jgi:hypothetical protein